jgi:hypothetical protein
MQHHVCGKGANTPPFLKNSGESIEGSSMRSVPSLILAGVVLSTAWVVGGCSSVDQIDDPNPAYETLVVAYGDPGPTAVPCDDALPKLDGVAEDREWGQAQPLFVRMSGDNGTGGADYFLEIRAIWTDEESRLGEGSDRIYFLVRYPDNDQDVRPDQLAYVFTPGSGDLECEKPVPIGGSVYCTSPTPRPRTPETPDCDTLLVKNRYWTRLNANGREDQVFFSITKVESAGDVSSLLDLNRELLGFLGPQFAAPRSVLYGGRYGADVWAWRSGRTNLHPVPQFPDWNVPLGENPIPPPLFSLFTQKCGYCEDLWVSGGTIQADAGQSPYLRNFGTTSPESGLPREIDSSGDTLNTVPIWLTECPPRGRDPSEEELSSLNGGLAKDLALWRPEAQLMGACDSLACSRTGVKPPKWSVKLNAGEFDFVQGWALRVPFFQAEGSTSARDVRARGVYELIQAKGFAVWSIELMRDLDTKQGDDLTIDSYDPQCDPESPEYDRTKTCPEYRMVIGVLDASGRVGSGSTEIRLKFQAPRPSSGVVERC